MRYVLGEGAARRLREMLAEFGGPASSAPTFLHRFVTHVRVTGPEADPGWYPCVPAQWDTQEEDWVEQDECWLYSPGGALAEGDRPIAIQAGHLLEESGGDVTLTPVFVSGREGIRLSRYPDDTAAAFEDWLSQGALGTDAESGLTMIEHADGTVLIGGLSAGSGQIGMVNITTQAFGGEKTFTAGVIHLATLEISGVAGSSGVDALVRQHVSNTGGEYILESTSGPDAVRFVLKAQSANGSTPAFVIELQSGVRHTGQTGTGGGGDTVKGGIITALGSGPSNVSDGDKGDITVASGVWTIDNGVVTFAKFQSITADRLLGRFSTGGSMQEISLSSAFELVAGPTLALKDAGVTLAKMADLANKTLIGRNTAGAGVPEAVTLTQLLDWIGSAAQGDILYRGAASWARLAAGTNGHFLKTQGAGANPAWAEAFSINGLTDADPAMDDTLPIADTSDSNNPKKVVVKELAGLTAADICGLRLTSSSTQSLHNGSSSAYTDIYLLPHHSRKLVWHDGTRLIQEDTDGLTLSMSGASANTTYYIYTRNNGGTLEIEASTTSPAVGGSGTPFEGLLTKNDGNGDRLYHGVVRTNSANQFADTIGNRCLGCAWWPVAYVDSQVDPADNWADSGNGSWSNADGGAAVWRHDLVAARAGLAFGAVAVITAETGYSHAITLDGTTPTRSTGAWGGMAGTGMTYCPTPSTYGGQPSIGHHFLQVAETTNSAASRTAFGDNTASPGGGTGAVQSGWTVWGWR